MVSTYDKALSRLKARRQENPEYAQMTRQLASMSTLMNKEQQSVNSRIGYTGNTLQAQVGAMLKNNASIGDIYGKVFNEAESNRANRISQIDNQIENVTMQRDAAKAAEEKAKKAQSQNLAKVGITTGMTLLGALVPGGGIVAPLIASSVGNLIAGSGILDATGDADPAMLMTAGSNLFQSVASIQSTAANKRTFQDASEFMSGTTKMFGADGATPLNYAALEPVKQDMFKTALASGNYDQVYSIMGKPMPKMRMGDYINPIYWGQ